MVDAVDPLFQQLGRDWMQQLNQTYSTADHMFGADGFFSTIHAPWATLDTEHNAKPGTDISDDDAESFELLVRTENNPHHNPHDLDSQGCF